MCLWDETYYLELLTSSERLLKDWLTGFESDLLNGHVQVRNTARFMLGNLFDFDPSTELLPDDQLLPLDQYALHLLHSYAEEVCLDWLTCTLENRNFFFQGDTSL